MRGSLKKSPARASSRRGKKQRRGKKVEAGWEKKGGRMQQKQKEQGGGRRTPACVCRCDIAHCVCMGAGGGRGVEKKGVDQKARLLVFCCRCCSQVKKKGDGALGGKCIHGVV